MFFPKDCFWAGRLQHSPRCSKPSSAPTAPAAAPALRKQHELCLALGTIRSLSEGPSLSLHLRSQFLEPGHGFLAEF